VKALSGSLYRTGDVAAIDPDGYFTYIGRDDDVFKASDYRISPFELESVLIEHPAVAEAAVIPSPDPLRLAVPKAFVALSVNHTPDRDTALSRRSRPPQFRQPRRPGILGGGFPGAAVRPSSRFWATSIKNRSNGPACTKLSNPAGRGLNSSVLDGPCSLL